MVCWKQKEGNRKIVSFGSLYFSVNDYRLDVFVLYVPPSEFFTFSFATNIAIDIM